MCCYFRPWSDPQLQIWIFSLSQNFFFFKQMRTRLLCCSTTVVNTIDRSNTTTQGRDRQLGGAAVHFPARQKRQEVKNQHPPTLIGWPQFKFNLNSKWIPQRQPPPPQPPPPQPPHRRKHPTHQQNIRPGTRETAATTTNIQEVLHQNPTARQSMPPVFLPPSCPKQSQQRHDKMVVGFHPLSHLLVFTMWQQCPQAFQ